MAWRIGNNPLIVACIGGPATGIAPAIVAWTTGEIIWVMSEAVRAKESPLQVAGHLERTAIPLRRSKFLKKTLIKADREGILVGWVRR